MPPRKRPLTSPCGRGRAGHLFYPVLLPAREGNDRGVDYPDRSRYSSHRRDRSAGWASLGLLLGLLYLSGLLFLAASIRPLLLRPVMRVRLFVVVAALAAEEEQNFLSVSSHKEFARYGFGTHPDSRVKGVSSRRVRCRSTASAPASLARGSGASTSISKSIECLPIRMRMPPFGTPFVEDTTFAATTFGQSIRNRFSCSAWATVLLTGLSSEPPQPEHMIVTPSRMLLSEMWVTLSSTRWPVHHLCNGKANSQANRAASGSLIFWMDTADGYPIGDTRRLYVIATFTCRPFGNLASMYFNSTVVRCSSERAVLAWASSSSAFVSYALSNPAARNWTANSPATPRTTSMGNNRRNARRLVHDQHLARIALNNELNSFRYSPNKPITTAAVAKSIALRYQRSELSIEPLSIRMQNHRDLLALQEFHRHEQIDSAITVIALLLVWLVKRR